MVEVRISDSLYKMASKAALAQHISLDRYVEEALQTQLEIDAPNGLTAEQAVIVAKAESDIDSGKFFTAEQVRGYFSNKNAASSNTGQP